MSDVLVKKMRLCKNKTLYLILFCILIFLDSGSQSANDLYEIPVQSTDITGNSSASNYETLKDEAYINCRVDEKV